MNPVIYNEYITTRINNDIQKKINDFNRVIQDKVTNEINNQLSMYQTPGTALNRMFINKFFTIITSTLVDDLNGEAIEYDIGRFHEIIDAYVDQRLVTLANDNVGSIVSKLTAELIHILENNESFNNFAGETLIQYFNARPTLRAALDNKIRELINDTDRIGLLIRDAVENRLNRDIGTETEKKIISIIERLSLDIIPRLLETMISVKVSVDEANVLKSMQDELYGDVINVANNNDTTNRAVFLDSFRTNGNIGIGGNIMRAFRRLYDALMTRILRKRIIYRGLITQDSIDILLGSVVSVKEPLDSIVRYVFLLDLLLKPVQEDNGYGPYALRFIELVGAIGSIFGNPIGSTSFNLIITKLYDFNSYLALKETDFILDYDEIQNPQLIDQNAIDKNKLYNADRRSIIFLFNIIKILMDKMKMRLLEASVAVAFSSDKLICEEIAHFRKTLYVKNTDCIR